MTEPTHGIVSPAWVDKLLAATFGGAVPEAVAPFIDAEACARRIDGSKLGVVFTVGAAERPRVRIAHDDESERLVALAKERFGAAAGWLDGYAGKDLLFETDGGSLRVYVTGVEGAGGEIGRIWQADGERTIVAHERAPTDVPPAIAKGVDAFAAKVDGGMFVTIRKGGQVESVLYTSDGAWSAALSGHIEDLGDGARRAAAHQVYADAGLRVHPYSVEFAADGVHVCLWGAFVGAGGDDLPGIFSAGVPDAATFAAELAQVLPDEDRDAGEAFVRDQVVPAMTALKPADKELAPHLADVWRFLIGLLALEAPFDRLTTLRRLHAANRPFGLQQEALHLAVARYLGAHPDTAPPAWLSDEAAALDGEAILARAAALRAELDELEAIGKDDPEYDVHRYSEVPFELPTIRDLLERATTGIFAAASGPLHDYLVELGAVGYDDDPSMVDLESVDLEADASRAAIEEALADDDDEL